MQIKVFQECTIPLTKKRVQSIAKLVLEGEAQEDNAALYIIFIDNKQITNLNRQFLQKEYATDVLAFPLDDNDVWSEIYISEEKAREQAERYHVSIQEELARLIIHGILHLIGYDDCSRQTKEKMREREIYYLNKLS